MWRPRDVSSQDCIAGRDVIEVGSGKGLTCLLLAISGARLVLSLEPELAGSTSIACKVQRQRIECLGLDNVELLAMDFNAWDPQGRTFDVLVSQASINHLFESRFHALHHRATFERYVEIACKFRQLLKPGGVACVSDACRYGLFRFARDYGLRRPWTVRGSAVAWRLHQNPETWRCIFREAGFSRVEIYYPLPYRLRHFGALVANPVINFFLKANFTLRSWK